MTYKQASAIRTAIDTMNSAFGTNFRAACLQRDPDYDEQVWQVFIYGEDGSELDYLRIHHFALAMCEMFATPYFYTTYDAGTVKNRNIKKAFRLW